MPMEVRSKEATLTTPRGTTIITTLDQPSKTRSRIGRGIGIALVVIAAWVTLAIIETTMGTEPNPCAPSISDTYIPCE